MSEYVFEDEFEFGGSYVLEIMPRPVLHGFEDDLRLWPGQYGKAFPVSNMASTCAAMKPCVHWKL